MHYVSLIHGRIPQRRQGLRDRRCHVVRRYVAGAIVIENWTFAIRNQVVKCRIKSLRSRINCAVHSNDRANGEQQPNRGKTHSGSKASLKRTIPTAGSLYRPLTLISHTDVRTSRTQPTNPFFYTSPCENAIFIVGSCICLSRQPVVGARTTQPIHFL